MTTALLATFLFAHGLIHLAIWVPKNTDESMPFVPDHSGLLAGAHVADHTVRTVAVGLAAAVAGVFGVAGIGVALSAPWTAPVAVAAALTGLLLKILYFHLWLSVGVLLDLAVLSAAATTWPIPLIF